MKQNQQARDIIVIGFALFAMFFGASNLIFPPYVGVTTGTSWFSGYFFYFLADAGLAVLGVIAMVRVDGKIFRITDVMGRVPSVILASAVIMCVGPGVTIPRTGAVSFELSIAPILGLHSDSKLALAIFTVIFFGIVIALTIRPSKVVDIVGKFLTPVLVIALLGLIIAGSISPKGEMLPPATDTVIRDGIYNGYQTMDLLGALFFAIIIITTLYDKGYKDEKQSTQMAIMASIVAGILLFVVYGGLAYLGATTGSVWRELILSGQLNQAGLLLNITEAILGRAGVIILGIAVAFACLTTAIGCTSATAEYFSALLRGKVSYQKLVVIICVVSALICNLGLSQIIAISGPILVLLLPVTAWLVATSFLRDKVKGLLPYRLSALVTFIISFIALLCNSFGVQSFVWVHQVLPLDDYGFGWILPAILAFLIGWALSEKKIPDPE